MGFSERELAKYRSGLASMISLKEKLEYLHDEFTRYDANNYSIDKEGRRYDNADTSIVKDWFRREIERINKELDRETLRETKQADKPTRKGNKPKEKPNKNDNNYTQRQVAIAYSFLPNEYLITPKNYSGILKKHTKTTSSKILQKRINRPSELTKLSENKSTDTKTKEDLMQAKRLLSGMNDSEAIKRIDDVINTFLANYNLKY